MKLIYTQSVLFLGVVRDGPLLETCRGRLREKTLFRTEQSVGKKFLPEACPCMFLAGVPSRTTPKNKTLWVYLSLLCLFCWLLVACNEAETLAPVTELNLIDAIPNTGVHRVLKGETLYEIAWRYGLDYRYLAKRNQIYPPYAIFVGQTIYLRGKKIINSSKTIPSHTKVHQAPGKTPVKHSVKTINRSAIDQTKKPSPSNQLRAVGIEPNYSITKWALPTKKSAIYRVSKSGKGVNIYGRLGEPIYAAGPGKVVYAGNGLRGYGNLIILKHNSLYLSAYAHNKLILVREGEWVRQGQKIAEMGNTDTNKVMLHFEIRQGGRSLNPTLSY